MMIAAQNWLFLRILDENQCKYLCMNRLHIESGFADQAQSRLIKPNQVIF
jgi:hypothetical protein